MNSFQQYLLQSVYLKKARGFFLSPFGKLPDFLIIGTQKGGTGSLIRVLAKHPDVYVPNYRRIADYQNIKNTRNDYGEIHFFNGPNWKYGLNWYRSLFLTDKVCGEKTPNYMTDKRAMKQIQDVIPQVKLIVCLRDPIYRLISQVNMRRGKGKKFPNLTVSDILNNPEYIERGMYYKQIKENILSYFDSNQLLICITDEELECIEKSRQEMILKVQKFLNLPVEDLEFKNYKSKKYSSEFIVTKEEISKLKEIYQHPNEQLFSFLGREIKSWGKLKNFTYLQ